MNATSTDFTITLEKRINENEIYVGSKSTTYCNLVKEKGMLSLDEAIQLRKDLIANIKKLGGKVSYKNGTLKTLKELAPQAEKEYALYLTRYDAVRSFASSFLKNIQSVTFEEKMAMEPDFDKMHNMRHEIEAMYFRNTALSQYLSCIYLLKDHASRLSLSKDASGSTYYL